MKCVNCGTEYEGKFCPECGTKTQESAPTPSTTEQQVNFQRQKVNQPLEAGKKGRKKQNKPKKPIYKKMVVLCDYRHSLNFDNRRSCKRKENRKNQME